MSRTTRFAARDAGPAARMAGFMAHLRSHGLSLGVGATELGMEALACVDCTRPATARAALRAVCAGSQAEAAQFDALFDAYWLNGGRVRTRAVPSPAVPTPENSSSELSEGASQGGRGQAESPDGGDGEADADGEGKLVASAVANLMKKDLRDLVSAADIRAAEKVAERLGRALRDRRSRRRKAAAKGQGLDMRRTLRRALATGGEPLRLARRHRPDRPVKIVALCDVSGSMTLYARVFLAFLAGLMRADPASDAYLFHTRLVRITQALRDDDPIRALNRLSLLADGFGGGSKIGAALEQFAATYARRFVDGRTVVLILSDGYDTAEAGDTGAALARLKKRGCKVIWLNPLKSWKDYAPVAGAMAAAMPHLDLFHPAATLADLAALETELGGV
ncbi:VWA domain-containing protein [Dinoroseobacter sp. PD6]|uniref:vWA domain-containing protein n=1 Tax=Dinoroseobacter sp. PD6 TaxID=3028384 RepID=UPI00237BB05D|nr:VWA domain-containing protein [Dinoroseobacter sp. PD6]MDD9716057.1 VWA domain-containing protein [Dinoroseobacter sp. PD6]